MYKINELVDQDYKIYELTDTKTDSRVRVAPERGGIIFSYVVRGEELLYLNKETFYDKTKNVRGGIPILFPISGQLTNGMYEWKGQTYSMPNHGFARNASWEVIDKVTTKSASLTLRLTSNEQTKLSYPFDFNVVFTYVLEEGKLTILQEYNNEGNSPMPIYAGFHPYFKTSEKNLAYETDATKYFDYNDSQEKEFKGGIDLSSLREAVVLLNSNRNNISFGYEKWIKLSYGNIFKYLMLWTESGSDFVCVEPWMAKTDELNRKEELVIINGNGSLKTEFSIEVVK